jgi:hypothetical protein
LTCPAAAVDGGAVAPGNVTAPYGFYQAGASDPAGRSGGLSPAGLANTTKTSAKQSGLVINSLTACSTALICSVRYKTS